jgi:hypothetical protein
MPRDATPPIRDILRCAAYFAHDEAEAFFHYTLPLHISPFSLMPAIAGYTARCQQPGQPLRHTPMYFREMINRAKRCLSSRYARQRRADATPRRYYCHLARYYASRVSPMMPRRHASDSHITS